MPIARHVAVALVGVALLAAAGAGTAAAGPLQVDIQAIGTHPDGELQDFADLDDVFDFGYGVRGDVMFGLNDHVYLGTQLGWYRSASGKLFDEFVDFDLDSYPIQGLIQVRAQHVIGLYAQAGAGFTHQKVSGDGAFSGSQNSFSWLLGGGLSFGLPGPIAFTAGVDYTALEPGEGDLWSGDDSIRFWMFSAGIRFHTK